MLFDTHSHIQFKVFEENISEVIDRAKKAGVNKIIACATNLESSKKAVNLVNRFEGIYAAVGIHPHHVFKHFHSKINLQSHLNIIESLLEDKKVVAIGEVGMDKYQYTKTKYKDYQIHEDFLKLQKKLFTAQIKLALKYKKSLIIHNRLAVKETLEVLKENWDPFFERRAVFHCCEPELELLAFALENKVYIGIDGDITYDADKQEFLKKAPFEQLVLETDSPFLIPQPLKSEETLNNEPKNLKIIAKKISLLKNHEVETVLNTCYQNSLKLFDL